mmetsp:Transcript_15229/g.22300  ORF Transcript_15229/g.22300 Transcript_15229/m.22300 type:complete len:105 (-) Transcript_15229:182-496(-)|eukprot:CAMPEP_0197246508 /NCGR_PEP_ID=MMETSP1429-20130617/14282_1 /TAXON_ID=49237 /ORGANISM="Chaetoceros  sp., Strain UNC1202" /LENGTH=104 /DNA_ID=CAMNT_0042707183 /DNA_START=32 /DNA_END=346 /DNA_ORIENTATION=+
MTDSTSNSVVPKSPTRVDAVGNSSISPPSSPRSNIRGRWTHNPVVLAALACTNMHSCEEVKNIYKECQKDHSDSMVCEAAEKYYRMCHLSSSDNDILEYSPYME